MSTPIDNAAATLPQDATSPSATPQLPDPGNVLNQMPVSSPEGILGVIPHEDWEKASAKGFKKAVFATSPEGKLGVLHPEDTPKAIQKGFQLGQPTPKTSIEEGSDAWYASKIPEPVMSVLSTIGKAFAAKDKAVHVAGDLAAAVPDLAVTPSGPDPSEVVANTKMAIAKGTHYSPTMPSDEEVNTAIHNAEVKHPVAMGVSRAIARTGGEMVADPLNWPFLASSAARPALQKLISGGFATQMGAGTLESAKHLYDNWDQMTPEQRAEYATQTGLQGLFTAATAKHAASGVIEPAKEIVSQVGKGIAESKPGQMVSEAVQGARAAWNPEKNLTPEQAATKAFRPRNSKSNWKAEVASALPDMKRAAEQRGADIENISLEDAQKIANAAKKDVWSEYEQNHLDPAKPVKVPVGEVGDAMRSKITDRIAEQNPKLAKRIDQVAATYDNRNLSVGEIQDRVSQLNNELRAIEAKYVTDKRAAKLSPGNAYKFAERDTLRGLLDDALEQTGGEGGDLLRKRWGALTSVEDAISRRVPVNERKNPVSLTRVFELLHGPGRIIRGLAGGGPGDVAMGVFNTKAMLNAEKMNNPDWLTQQAFKKTTSRPAWMPREVHEGEYVGPATRGKIGSGLPWIGRTRGMLPQGGGFELPPASRTYGVPEQPIVDAPNTPIGNDVLENQPRGTVTPLGPTGKAGVLKRPFFLKGEISPDREAINGKPGQAESAAVPVGHDQNNARPEADQGAQKEVKERRQNLAERKRVEHMSPEEMKKELLTSPVTGLPNKRAFDEAQHQPAKAVAMSDADGLKALNDKFGYDAGNELLKAKAEALKEAGLDAYHEKGDEFLFRGASKEELHSKLEKAREILRNRVIEVQMKDGSARRFKGADFSHGNGSNLAEAESGLKTNKSEREARGERARGELRGITQVESRPSAVSESPAQEVTASPSVPAVRAAVKSQTPTAENAWIKRIKETEAKSGYEKAAQRASDIYRSLSLGRHFNETNEAYDARKPDVKEFNDWYLTDFKKQAKSQPAAAPSNPPAPETAQPKIGDAADRTKLRDLQSVRFKTAGQEQQIEHLKARIAADPSKWKEGDGVGWKVYGNQINRGFRIVDINPETKEATIRQVADTGLTTSGGDNDRIGDTAVHIADLVRDNKYSAKPASPTAGSPEYEALKAKVSQLEKKRSGKGIVGVLGKKAEVANESPAPEPPKSTVPVISAATKSVSEGDRSATLQSEIDALKQQRKAKMDEMLAHGAYDAKAADLRKQHNELMSQIGQREDELARLRGEPTRAEKREAAKTEEEKKFGDRPAKAMKYGDIGQSQPWQVKESDYIDKRFDQLVSRYEKAIPEQEAEVAKTTATSQKGIQARASLKYWQELLKAYRDHDPRKAQEFKNEYIKLIKEAVSHGKPVPDEVIQQKSEFTLARDARERYEKGRHTSFANRSVAVNDTMQKDLGYKVKRQDGKPITDDQIKEIHDGVADVEKVFGPMHNVLRGVDLTIAHTSGKQPFLMNSVGGLFSEGDRRITIGISDILGRPVRAFAHEFGHMVDIKAGDALGVNKSHVWFKGNKRNSAGETSSLAENEDRSGENKLFRDATAKINDIREIHTLLKARSAEESANLPEDKKVEVQRAKIQLGPYWREPREVFARLFEQYVANEIGKENSASHAPQYYAKRPGWWTQEEFDKLKPAVKQAIDRRVKLLRDNYDQKESTEK